MKQSIILFSFFMALLLLVLWVPEAGAYERYNDGCQNCHGAFTDDVSPKGNIFTTDSKHEMHRSASEMNTECNLCHTSGDQKNPFMGSSNGTSDNPGLGCTGCHNAPGLWAHHNISGVGTCAGCHGLPAPPLEDQAPPYYGTVDTLADSPCNPNPDFMENWTIGDTEGLDNDGDGVYDMSDSDCAVLAPGETSGPALSLMQITSYDPAAMLMSLSYGNPCDAASNAIIYGPLNDVGQYNYTGGNCSVGNSGTVTDWSYALAPDSYFFLMVADNGSAEGSYGAATGGGERPSDDLLVPPACFLPQDLPNRCD